MTEQIVIGKDVQPTPNPSKLKVLVFDNGTASRKWRFEGVAERLNVKTEHEMFVASHGQWNGDIIGSNLVILEMLTGPHIVDECKAKGAKVIYEADDAVVDSYGRERKNLQFIGPAWKASAIETIARCDAITVTNRTLAENYARFTKKPIYILPNYVDFLWYGKEDIRIERTTNEIRIGWFGSKGHFEDLKMVLPALKKVLEKYPQTKLVYCGFGGMSSSKLLTEIGWGEDVFKGIPRSRREFYTPVQYDYWPHKHRLLDFDIGLAPLIDDHFNHCKSHIKWMEYSILRTPTVCSPTVYSESPYGEGRTPAVKHGKTGFIAKTEDEWVKYLSQLVEDAELRKKMAKDAQNDVLKNWDLESHWSEFVNVYQKVLNSK